MLISPAQAQAVLSKSAYWQRREAANQSCARLDRGCTAIGRISPVRPCPSELCHFLPVSRGMDGGRPALEITRLESVKSRLDRDWPAIGGFPGKVVLYNPHMSPKERETIRQFPS